MKIQMIVASHKACEICPDPMYLPVHAGAAIHDYTLEFIGDNTGENISEKNASFCELTALYWAWKNLDADYIGLCHYRRYFGGKRFGEKNERILTLAQAEKLLQKTDILLPKPRNYFIETNYSQYIHAHHAEDLEVTRAVLQEKDPDGRYVSAYDKLMKRTDGHRFNMLMMRGDCLDSYCSWLFDVLFEVEKRLDISGYDPYNARVFGFLSERLLDVWLNANGKQYLELPYVFIGSENWPKKIVNFLKRKFGIR